MAEAADQAAASRSEQPEVGETGCRQDLLLTVGIEVQEGDLGLAAVASRANRAGKLGPEARTKP